MAVSLSLSHFSLAAFSSAAFSFAAFSRRNNLKKVANGIRIYIEQILNAENTGVPDVEDFLSEIDLGLMAKDALCENEATKEEMTKLVQLILSSCVHGDNQASYVQTIMGLDEDVQEQLMHSIHGMSDLFQSGANGSPPPSPLSSPKAIEQMASMQWSIARMPVDKNNHSGVWRVSCGS